MGFFTGLCCFSSGNTKRKGKASGKVRAPRMVAKGPSPPSMRQRQPLPREVGTLPRLPPSPRPAVTPVGTKTTPKPASSGRQMTPKRASSRRQPASSGKQTTPAPAGPERTTMPVTSGKQTIMQRKKAQPRSSAYALPPSELPEKRIFAGCEKDKKRYNKSTRVVPIAAAAAASALNQEFAGKAYGGLKNSDDTDKLVTRGQNEAVRQNTHAGNTYAVCCSGAVAGDDQPKEHLITSQRTRWGGLPTPDCSWPTRPGPCRCGTHNWSAPMAPRQQNNTV